MSARNRRQSNGTQFDSKPASGDARAASVGVDVECIISLPESALCAAERLLNESTVLRSVICDWYFYSNAIAGVLSDLSAGMIHPTWNLLRCLSRRTQPASNRSQL